MNLSLILFFACTFLTSKECLKHNTIFIQTMGSVRCKYNIIRIEYTAGRHIHKHFSVVLKMIFEVYIFNGRLFVWFSSLSCFFCLCMWFLIFLCVYLSFGRRVTRNILSPEMWNMISRSNSKLIAQKQLNSIQKLCAKINCHLKLIECWAEQ